ncbi:uncharacterized protein [Neodiprion pinetum]|uniref:uncharacterized protein n=1 Tax=Neodiprion pinetum TaxID=441929 RepID=UPI003716B8F8
MTTCQLRLRNVDQLDHPREKSVPASTANNPQLPLSTSNHLRPPSSSSATSSPCRSRPHQPPLITTNLLKTPTASKHLMAIYSGYNPRWLAVVVGGGWRWLEVVGGGRGGGRGRLGEQGGQGRQGFVLGKSVNGTVC